MERHNQESMGGDGMSMDRTKRVGYVSDASGDEINITADPSGMSLRVYSDEETKAVVINLTPLEAKQLASDLTDLACDSQRMGAKS